jgi:hypothetical protein
MNPLLLELGPVSTDGDVLLTRSHCIAAGCEVVAVKPEHVQYCLAGSVVGVQIAGSQRVYADIVVCAAAPVPQPELLHLIHNDATCASRIMENDRFTVIGSGTQWLLVEALLMRMLSLHRRAVAVPSFSYPFSSSGSSRVSVNTASCDTAAAAAAVAARTQPPTQRSSPSRWGSPSSARSHVSQPRWSCSVSQKVQA